VWLVAGTWRSDLLDEIESFPNGRFQDQVDACRGVQSAGERAQVYFGHGLVGRLTCGKPDCADKLATLLQAGVLDVVWPHQLAEGIQQSQRRPGPAKSRVGRLERPSSVVIAFSLRPA
jgi:hypothetical protein